MSIANDGYQCFKAFVALKLHFNTPKYDIFEKKGRVNISPEAYARRDDYYLYEKLVRKHPLDYKKVLLANFAYCNVSHITEIEHSRYIEWIRRREALAYLVRNDLESLDVDRIEFALDCRNGQHPKLFSRFVGNKIMLETVTLLNHTLKFFPAWDEHLKGDFVWQSLGPRLKKFSGFMRSRDELVYKTLDEVF